MLFRRVRKHVKAQDWFAVGVDFVIVVIGVFIGIQVANWNEVRQERIREAHYLERLDIEFDTVRERLIGGKAVFGDSVRSINKLLEIRRRYAARSGAAVPSDEVIASLLQQMSSGRVPAGSPAAFREMVASGSLETMSSDALRQALFEYDEFAVVAREAWRSLRAVHRNAEARLVGLLDHSAPEQLEESLVSESRVIAESFVVVGFDRERFLNDPTVGDDLNVLLRAQTNQFTLVARQLTYAEEIEDLISAVRKR